MNREKISTEEISLAQTEMRQGENILDTMYKETLLSESFEDVAETLEKVEALRDFREKLRDMPFGSFHTVIEEMTNINKAKALLSKEEKERRVEHLTSVMEERAGRLSPRVADLYMAILSEIKGEEYKPKYEITAKKIDELKKEGDLNVLFSPDVPWDLKLNRIETRLTDYLLGAKAFDRREGQEMDDDISEWRAGELKKAPTTPTERRNESKPGVDPMERLKEGERVPAIWTISPAYGGYYKQQSFSQWDNKRNVWTEEYTYSEAETIPVWEKENIKKGLVNLTMSAKTIAGKWISLAIPYTHNLHKVEAGAKNVSVQKDQNNDLVIWVEGEGEEVEIKVVLAPNPDKKFTSTLENIKVPDMPAVFSKETDEKLEKIKVKKRDNIARARAISVYVRSKIAYLAPKDYIEANEYNNKYNSHPKGFAAGVEEAKKADCDVANTYFAALCVKLRIPVRHCIGHSVRGRDEKVASNINSGTGHGWSEVWDERKKEWIRIDATPPGDRQLEDEKEVGEESIPGDYGEEEAIGPSEEELEALRQKLAEQKEKLSYTREERQLAEATGIELKEARQIVKEINEAEQTRLPNGELITDALSRLFNAIVESRRAIATAYTGPVRKREGGDAIEDIVRHTIGVRASDFDPKSREKPTEKIKEEKIISGFDLHIIGDKSYSMSSTVEGEALWKMQRRAEYLIFSSLHRFERNLERASLLKENALSVRTQGISFRGSEKDEIDLDKPLSPKLEPKDKVKLWHSLTEIGTGNGDPEALGIIYEQIKEEIGQNKKRGIKDNRLRIVIACSDGGYVGNDSAKMQLLSEELHKLNVVVVGIGLTETAEAVKVVMDNPPFSHGDIVRDINDLPAVVAKHLVLEAIKLFPEKAKKGAEQTIRNALAKFKNIR